jgi:hypothetical protein
VGYAVQWYLETLGAMSFSHGSSPSKVSTMPPADEAGGIVRRTTTRMRYPYDRGRQPLRLEIRKSLVHAAMELV